MTPEEITQQAQDKIDEFIETQVRKPRKRNTYMIKPSIEDGLLGEPTDQERREES